MSTDIAKELTILARDVFSSLEPVTENDIVGWELELAEGPMDESDRVEGKKGKTVREMSRLLRKYPKPDRGYNKIYFDVNFADGEQLSFKYYHGKSDPDLTVQAQKWLSSLSR